MISHEELKQAYQTIIKYRTENEQPLSDKILNQALAEQGSHGGLAALMVRMDELAKDNNFDAIQNLPLWKRRISDFMPKNGDWKTIVVSRKDYITQFPRYLGDFWDLDNRQWELNQYSSLDAKFGEYDMGLITVMEMEQPHAFMFQPVDGKEYLLPRRVMNTIIEQVGSDFEPQSVGQYDKPVDLEFQCLCDFEGEYYG